MAPLHRRVLGEAFDTLPPVLRRFHDAAEGGTATGILRVTRGPGRLRNMLTSFFRLPPVGDRVSLRVRVVVQGARELWVREFDGVCMATLQWEREGLLIEAAGPVRIAYRLTADPTGLRFESVRAWLFGLPLPRRLSPRIQASAEARSEGWWIDIRVDAPLAGLLVHYEGEVVPHGLLEGE